MSEAALLPLWQKEPESRCDESLHSNAKRSHERLCDSRARWAVLACVSTMPMGIHACYKMTSGLQKHLMEDAFHPPIDAFKYGFLNSAVSWINIVVPFVSGSLVDAHATRYIGVASLVVGVCGQLLFACGISSHMFGLSLAGRIVFGLGEGSVMIAQGAACAQWFGGAELTFAIAITEMTHNMANWTGQVAVSLAIDLGGWWITAWLGALMCVLGLLSGFLFAAIERRYEQSHPEEFRKQPLEPLDLDISTSLAPARTGRRRYRKNVSSKMTLKIPCAALRKLTNSFWIILMIHLLVSNVEHIFDTISANFIEDKWHYHTSEAAWLSSLNSLGAIVLCPMAGMLIDRSNSPYARVCMASLGCCILGAAHLLLGLTSVHPAIGLSMLSLPVATMPTLLRSSVPLVVRSSVVGLAFGLFSVAENLGKMFGAPVVGYVRDQNGNYLWDELGFAAVSFMAAFLAIILFFKGRHDGTPDYSQQSGILIDERFLDGTEHPRTHRADPESASRGK